MSQNIKALKQTNTKKKDVGRNLRHRTTPGPLRPSAEDMATPELIAQLEAMGI